MASNINYEDIDQSFPKTGVDNPSQGFRDNFSVIKDSLQTAKEEISTLQSTTAKINDENDFNGNLIKQAKFVNCVQESFTRTTPSNTDQIVDFINGNYQEFRLDKNTNFVLQGWPQSDGYASLRIALFSTTDVSHIATFRINGSGTISYDQETTYTEVGESNGQPVQVVVRGMSSSQLIGPDVKVYEFWTKTNGSLVYARYLGIYDTVAPSQTGNTTLSAADLSVLGNVTVGDTMTLSKVSGTSLDVKGDSVFAKNVVIEGDLTITGDLNKTIANATIADLGAIGDVTISEPSQGDTIRYDESTQRWTNQATANIVTFFIAIGDNGSSQEPDVIFLGSDLGNLSPLQDYLGNQTTLTFEKDTTYRFRTDDSSNNGYTLKFSTTPDLEDPPAGITPYTTFVSNIGIPGTAGSYTEIIVTDNTPSPLYFYFEGNDTGLYGAGYPIAVNNGDVKVVNKKYKSIGNQRISVDTTRSPITIVLPSAAESSPGMYVTVIDNGNASTNNITIDRNNNTINGSNTNKVININYNSLTLISDGTGNWSLGDPLADGGIVKNITDSVNVTSGALQIQGGVGISKTLNVGLDINTSGSLSVDQRTILNATSTLLGSTNIDLSKSAYYSDPGSRGVTLDTGEPGQILYIARRGAGTLTVTVANAAWENGAQGLMILDEPGHGATLMYMNNQWFCVGNNGARFGAVGEEQSLKATHSLEDLSSVAVTTPLTIGQVLKWNGTAWTNGVDSGSTLGSLTDVTLTAVTNDQVLKYNGIQWVNATDNT